MSGAASTAPVGVTGRLTDLSAAQLARLLERGASPDPEVERATAAAIADVRARGDAALLDLARRYDAAVPQRLEVPREACRHALAELAPALRAALEEAAANVRAFHAAQLPDELEVEVRPGVRLGRRPEPLARVGVYAPGGRASYPSSVLMGVVPARVAGVGEVVVCSPPGPDGLPPAAVLAACALAGADRVFAVGGAGAVAAMALGTQSVPRVDKVVGPGNAYVTEAKRQLNGVVAIDCPAGPSEVLVVADATADPELVALELLAQAEHDPRAAAVLVSVGAEPARAVADALARLLPSQARREVSEASLRAAGALLVADDLEAALAFAARYAPEHLLLMLAEPRAALPRVRNAGTVFLGASSSVAFGDYVTGANHTLPTGGLARAYSGLSTLDFVRLVTYQEVSPAAAVELAPVAATLAAAEGLPGHAAAARARAGAVGSAPTGDAADGRGRGADADYSASPRLRAAYRVIEPYDPRRAPVAVDLSDNTNLFGPNPTVMEALRALGPQQVSRYPDVYARQLREAIAELHGVEPENVTTGAGLDGVIDAAVRAFCDPGATVAFPDPTFGMVALFARMNAARPLPVPVTEALDVDMEALLATRAAVTYVCDPNNPTGKPLNPGALARLGAEAEGVVLVDQAYADFAGPVAELGARDAAAGALALCAGNTLVLRTLSKAHGLAGLRVGYALGPAELIREVEKARGPYAVSAAAEAAALAALRAGREWVQDVVERTIANRERLTAELRLRGLNALPSAANFVLVPLAAEPVAALAAALRARGVAVRAFPDLARVGPALRVSVGPWPLLERFLAALDETLAVTPARSPR